MKYFYLYILLLLLGSIKTGRARPSGSCDSLRIYIAETRILLLKGEFERADLLLHELNQACEFIEECDSTLSIQLVQLNLLRENYSTTDSQNPSPVQQFGTNFPVQVNTSLSNQSDSLLLVVENLSQQLEKERHQNLWRSKGINLGISFGFNYFFNQQKNYVIGLDSLVYARGRSNGMSFLLSGVITYRFNEKHAAIINIPLSEFNSNSESAIGLFNRQAAGGIGYGYHIGNLSFIGIINLSPYKKIEIELFKEYKSSLPAFTSLPPEDFGTSVAYSPSITIGIAYQLVEGFSPFPRRQ